MNLWEALIKIAEAGKPRPRTYPLFPTALSLPDRPKPDLSKMPLTVLSNEVLSDPGLKAIDLKAELYRAAAMRALHSGQSVTITCGGRELARFHPDGTTETFRCLENGLVWP